VLEQLQRTNTIASANQYVQTTTCQSYQDFESQHTKSMSIVNAVNAGIEKLVELKKQNS